MSRWTYEEKPEGEIVLTCKGPSVTMFVYADVVPEPDAAATFSLSPAKALEMAENLTLYDKEAAGWTRDPADIDKIVKGCVVSREGRKRVLQTDKAVESARIDGSVFVAERAHADDDYSYLCGSQWCRCVQ